MQNDGVNAERMLDMEHTFRNELFVATASAHEQHREAVACGHYA